MLRSTRKIFGLFLILTILLGMTACGTKEKAAGPQILDMTFLAATGDSNHPNSVSLSTYGVRAGPGNAKKTGSYVKFEKEWLTSEDAIKLIELIRAMPDVIGKEKDGFAYSINLRFTDKDDYEYSIKKKGYGAFPDNWKEIVGTVNKVTHDAAKITDKTEITKIDGAFLKKNFNVDEDLLPYDLTLDDYIEISGLSYEELFGTNSYYRFSEAISDFCYGYLNIGTYRLFKDTKAESSSAEELQAYAGAKLDVITSKDDICIAGNYRGKYYQIVRFDSVDQWQKNQGINSNIQNTDDSIDYQIWESYKGDDTAASTVFQVYVEPEHRFLIITQERAIIDYREIAGFFNR